MEKLTLEQAKDKVEKSNLTWEEQGQLLYPECKCCGFYVSKEYVRPLRIPAFDIYFDSICFDCSYELFSIPSEKKLQRKYA